MLSELLKKLLFVRQFNMDQGKIEILGKRHIMLSDTALLDLQNVDETKFYELMKQSTLKQINDFVNHAKVYKQLKSTISWDVSDLSKKLGSSEGIVKNSQEIFNLYGLGLIEIVDLSNEKKTAIVKIRDSTIAKAYLERNKSRSKNPVCVITAAVLAGIFSYLFQKSVDAAETSCNAQSSGNCQFIIK